MNITEEKRNIIFKHEGVETEGLHRQLGWIFISLCTGLAHAMIHWDLSILDFHAATITSITLALTVYAFIYLLDLQYMKLYRRYDLVKESAMEVVKSNTPNEFNGLGDLSDFDLSAQDRNSHFSKHASDEDIDSRASRQYYDNN